MKEQPNPYAAPVELDAPSRSRARGLPLASAIGFSLLLLLFEFVAFVTPSDAPLTGTVFQSIWLSCWLSGLVSRQFRKAGEVRSARWFAMLLGLAATVLMGVLMEFRPIALTAGVIAAGVGTYWIHENGRGALRPSTSKPRAIPKT